MGKTDKSVIIIVIIIIVVIRVCIRSCLQNSGGEASSCQIVKPTLGRHLSAHERRRQFSLAAAATRQRLAARRAEPVPCGFQERFNNLALGALGGFTLQRELAISQGLGGFEKKRARGLEGGGEVSRGSAISIIFPARAPPPLLSPGLGPHPSSNRQSDQRLHCLSSHLFSAGAPRCSFKHYVIAAALRKSSSHTLNAG